MHTRGCRRRCDDDAFAFPLEASVVFLKLRTGKCLLRGFEPAANPEGRLKRHRWEASVLQQRRDSQLGRTGDSGAAVSLREVLGPGF